VSLPPRSYVAITPARDEAANLRRLAESLAAQTVQPQAWIVVDNGSTDDTCEFVAELARIHSWVHLRQSAGAAHAVPGAPIVRAFHVGIEALVVEPEVVVKLDADVSLPPDYFEHLLAAFGAEPSLGIAGGVCLEHEGGVWKETHVTGNHVRGAVRAYRWACLSQLLPLEERMGWDTLDELSANVRGWTTRIVPGLRFYHHRSVGERDGSPHRRWLRQGEGAYYMGYRLSYLVFRTLHRALREPRALAMLWAYLRAMATRQPRYIDLEVREHLRRQQRLRALPERIREAFGR
jgi:glycosyltransferase involved in cell wall biosynthesis